MKRTTTIGWMRLLLAFLLPLMFSVPLSAGSYEIRISADIPVGGEISGISLDPVKGALLALDRKQRKLHFIDGSKGKLTGTLTLERPPLSAVMLPGMDKAFVLTTGNELLQIDLAGLNISGSARLEERGNEIAFDSILDALLVCGADGVTLIGPDDLKVIQRITLPSPCRHLLSDAGYAIAVTGDETGGTVLGMDLSTGMILQERPLQSMPEHFDADFSSGNLILYFPEGKIEIYDIPGPESPNEVSTVTNAGGMGISSLTGKVFLSDTAHDRLTVIDLRNRRGPVSVPFLRKPGPMEVNSLSNIAFIAHEGGIAVVELENPIPVIDRLVPSKARAGGRGFSLSIEGENFISTSQAEFNEREVPTYFLSNRRLKAHISEEDITIPGNVPVTVTCPPPGGGRSNTLYFRILIPPPRVDSVEPDEVEVNSSPVIRVKGSNFLPSSVVNLNGDDLRTRFISSILLEAEVPSSATARPGDFPLLVVHRGPEGFTSNPLMLRVVDMPDMSEKAASTSKVTDSHGLKGSLRGRILNTGLQPVEGVTISIEGLSAVTDSNGRFLIEGIPAGRGRLLLVDGSTVPDGGAHYPTIPVNIDIKADTINEMPFQVYLHHQKARNFRYIDSRKITAFFANAGGVGSPDDSTVLSVENGGTDMITTEELPDFGRKGELIVRDPEVPGAELMLPDGVKITGWDGKPNEKVSIRTVPSDRLPVKPLPPGSGVRTVYMFYFNKKGGGVPDKPIPFKAPNDLGLLPGEKAVLWYYDESPIEGEAPNDWAVAGTGTVTSDGRYIVTDPGVGIPKFCCGATGWGGSGNGAPGGGPDGGCDNGCCGGAAGGGSGGPGGGPAPTGPSGTAGDPVDLATGYFLHARTDLVIPGIMPVKIARYYRSGDPGVGMFGMGTYFEYDWWLGQYQDMLLLIKPGNYQYRFPLQPDGTYRNETDPAMRGVVAVVNADGTKTLRMKDGTVYTFDQSGDLTGIEERNGNMITLTRRSDFAGGYLTEMILPGGKKVTFRQTYGFTSPAIFRTDEIIDPYGRKIKYIYLYEQTHQASDWYKLWKVEYPDGTHIEYTYDSKGRMNGIINERGILEVLNEYDENDRVIRQTHADGGVFTFSYTVAGGFVTETGMTDPEGHTTMWRFNSYGYITEKTTPDGKTVYDRAPGTNEILRVRDPLGREVTYTYDERGNIISVTDNSGNTTHFEYDGQNRLVRKTDALGNETLTEYDARGNPVSMTDPLGNRTVISYNEEGKPVEVTDPLGGATVFEYDGNGNLTRTTDPEGDITEMSYDLYGNLVKVKDAEGNVTEYSYDRAGRVTEVKDPRGGVTRFTYDEKGNLLSVTDALGHTITYEYNVRDRLVKMTDQLGRMETYEYDHNDNLTRVVDRKGQATAYTYDGMNRIKRVDYADGSYTTYTYDATGRLTQINDSISGQIEYSYTGGGCSTGTCGGGIADKVVQETTPLGSISYTYDALGRRTSMTVAGQPAVNYSYDNAGRMTGISVNHPTHGLLDFGFAYDSLGRRTSLTYPNGVTTTYTYDKAGRLLNLEHLGPLNHILEKISYLYDRNGNRTAMDRLNVQPKLPTPVVRAAYNSANRMLTFQPEGGIIEDMAYDENGNLVSVTNACGTTTYTWDVRNRLVSINGFDADCQPMTASFKYDALGRRIEKTIDGRTIQYLYDGLDIIQEIEDGMVTANYIRTLNIDEPLARIKSDGTIRYYHADALGSVIALTDETGNVRTQYNYSPFGETELTGEPSDNPFQYTGRENDLSAAAQAGGTGLYYYRARYYSPGLKRFVSGDPIRFKGGDVNFYVYVTNRPTMLIDPLGLAGCGPGEGLGDWLVPDYPYGMNFKSCCDKHDDCYGCKGQKEGKTKKDCDFDFCICLLKKNMLFPPIPALTYCAAVVFGGQSSFDKARRPKP